MKIKNKKIKNGFTLIEIVVYLALFSILFGGAIVASYNLIEGNARSQTEVLMQNEGDFLIAKISWAIANLNGENITDIIKLNGNNITIYKNGSTQVLNNTNVSVSNLHFTQSDISSTNWKDIEFSFTITSLTPNGMSISQDFSGQKYEK